jgi:hypothetical protein
VGLQTLRAGSSFGELIVAKIHHKATSQPALKPISDPVAFKSLIENSITGLTIPPHPGVENLVLCHAGGTEGFVVTHIPVGMDVPYRTLVEKEEYYIRAGSNFVPAPHAVLSGLFGRVPNPVLEIAFGIQHTTRAAGSLKQAIVHLPIFVLNNGRGTAEGLYFSIEARLHENYAMRWLMNSDQWQTWMSKLDIGERLTAVASSFPPLPPGSTNQLLRLLLEVPNPCERDIQLDITCGARGGPATARTILLPANVLGPAIEHRCHNYGNAADYDAAEKLHNRNIEALLKST